MENRKTIAYYYQPKTIWFTYSKGLIGDGIRECQNIVSLKDFKAKSLFSHVVIITPNRMVYESTAEIKIVKIPLNNLPWIKISIPQIKIINGVKKTPMEKFYKKLENSDLVGVQYDFEELTDKVWDEIGNRAEELYQQKIKYGFQELFGTLGTLIKYKFFLSIGKKEKALKIAKEKNKLDKEDKMYCISFVEEVLEKFIEYCNPKWHNSNLTVCHGWHTKAKCKKEIFQRIK